MRELCLVFGSSTAASAAVLAIFMGGLGLGGWLLGRRADAAANPLAFIRLEVASYLDLSRYAAALAEVEPNVPWRAPVLERRARAYEAAGSPLAQRARKELADFLEKEPPPFAPGPGPEAAPAKNPGR
jgi:spermidine synthase